MPGGVKAIGRRLLAEATPGGDGLQPLATGLRVAGKRLEGVLSPVIGSQGYRAVVTSALNQASSRHPFLREIAVYEDGIDAGEVVARHDDGESQRIREGFQDGVESIVALLAELIGEGLTATLLREALEDGNGEGAPEGEKGAGRGPSPGEEGS